MKKIVLIIILIISTISCHSDKIQGSWIGTYSYFKNDSIFQPTLRKVITFDKNTYNSYDFKYDYSTETYYKTGEYNMFSESLTNNENSNIEEFVESITKDSLIIKESFTDNNYVYKKLNDSLKAKSNEKIDLIGKVFLLKSENKLLDTIYFKNDSIIVAKSDKTTKHQESFWERIDENGFDIIFIQYDIPYIIREKKENIIYMIGIHKKTYNIELEELNKNVW